MANFKLYLLSLRDATGQKPIFLANPISVFSNKHEESADDLNVTYFKQNNFCYTYNEKFQQHENNQRTLSFSMDQKVTREDRIETNPFIYYLYAGAQLLLVDKFNNHHLMTVSKISFTFKEHNTVYNYECKDSFSYQLSKQNNGYEIVNDSSSSEFIGAQQVDWWVLCKIHPECNISYKYTKLADSLTVMGKQVKKPTSEKSFFQWLTFSGSGTAASVLISLGDLIGLQLKTYERFNFETGELEKHYWFEPKKALVSSGLKYSPHSNIQSFSMSHDSTSLSSVLNVEAHTVGDEMISLIPSVPLFFKRWFTTASWKNTKFTTGLFSSTCQESVTIIKTPKKVLFDSTTKEVSIDITGLLTLNHLYDKIRFNDRMGSFSRVTYGSVEQTSKNSLWKIVFKNTKGKTYTIIDGITQIPKELFEENISSIQVVFLDSALTSAPTFSSCNLVVSLFRDTSKEEIEFAEIADQCPWLENRLINFEYFLDHSIISKKQYSELMTIIQEDLRLANSKMLVYSEEYYRAWQHKTEVIAKLSSQLDTLGAIFQADFIDAYNKNNKTLETKNFTMALSALYKNNNSPVLIIDYYKTLNEYVNKYITAEQVFLKNMYQFKKYFESPIDFSDQYWEYTFEAPSGDDKTKYAFTEEINNWSQITSSNNIQGRPLYRVENGNYFEIDKNDIVTEKNYTDFYIEKAFSDTLVSASGPHKNGIQYYKKEGSKYVPVDLLDMKIAYVLGNKAKAKSLQRKIDLPLASAKSLATEWSNLLINGALLAKLPSMSKEEDGNLIKQLLDPQNNTTTCWNVYKANFPLTSLTYNGETTIQASFVNVENVNTFYRRISTKNRWMIGVAPILTLGLKTSALIELYMKYKTTGFGTEGWTYQDIFGNSDGITPFKGYTNAEGLFYTNTEEGFEQSGLGSSADAWTDSAAKNIALRYSSLTSKPDEDKDKYSFKTTRWRIMRLVEKDNSYIPAFEKGENYFLLCRDDLTDGSTFWVPSAKGIYIDTTIYYPLKNALIPLTTNSVVWDENGKANIRNFLNDIGVFTVSEYYITKNTKTYYIVHEEDWDYETPVESPAIEIAKEYALSYWFDANLTKVYLQEQNDFTNGFYIVNSGDNSYEKAENFNASDDQYWYKKIGSGKYEKVYTLKQWINRGCYVNLSSSYKYYSFDEIEEKEFFLYRFIKDSNNNWVFDDEVQQTLAYKTKTKKEFSGTASKGSFWYRNYSSNISILAEQAMVIESTLSEYWTNAYYASKNCRFFIPQFWQPSVDQTINYFSGGIIGENDSDDLVLKETFIPTVKLLSQQTQYRYEHVNSSNGEAQKLAINHSLPINTAISAYSICGNINSIQDIFNYLNLSPSEWKGISVSNDFTYYEYQSGGMLWKDALVKLSNGALSYPDRFGGWYDMMINILQNGNYINHIPQQYYESLKEHNAIWKKLYTKYPNLILEKSYRNEDSTTSLELLNMAKLSFNDYTTIETNYNITTIDPYSIKGYIGQELKIGDSIELEADELYSDYSSDVYKSLQQYLYITDINYNLRSDKDIQLTVNTIKYADKVIGELVKLIR